MDLKTAVQTQAALKVFGKAGEAINAIDKADGKVDRSLIDRANAVKIPLLRLIITTPRYAETARHTLIAINEAVKFAEGDSTAKQRYLDACQRANALNYQLKREVSD